jgi:hypothetical protein
MPTTRALAKAHSNIWHLTTSQGQLLDSVTTPNQAEAALAVQHLLPRRSEVISHARHH